MVAAVVCDWKGCLLRRSQAVAMTRLALKAVTNKTKTRECPQCRPEQRAVLQVLGKQSDRLFSCKFCDLKWIRDLLLVRPRWRQPRPV